MLLAHRGAETQSLRSLLLQPEFENPEDTDMASPTINIELFQLYCRRFPLTAQESGQHGIRWSLRHASQGSQVAAIVAKYCLPDKPRSRGSGYKDVLAVTRVIDKNSQQGYFTHSLFAYFGPHDCMTAASAPDDAVLREHAWRSCGGLLKSCSMISRIACVNTDSCELFFVQGGNVSQRRRRIFPRYNLPKAEQEQQAFASEAHDSLGPREGPLARPQKRKPTNVNAQETSAGRRVLNVTKKHARSPATAITIDNAAADVLDLDGAAFW